MIDVVIPWRPTPDRQPLLDYVVDWWRSLGFAPIIAEHSDGPWVKAKAVTPAVETSTADIIVIADADVICDGITDALLNVDTWAAPHLYVHRLDQPSTELVLAGGNPPDGSCVERPYKGHLGGGIVVLRRDVYLDCPLDMRFEGWGQEDAAFALALTCLHGPPWRGTAPLFHLWHEPQSRRSRGIGNDEGLRMFRRYKSARTSPERMRELINEAVTVP